MSGDSPWPRPEDPRAGHADGSPAARPPLDFPEAMPPVRDAAPPGESAPPPSAEPIAQFDGGVPPAPTASSRQRGTLDDAAPSRPTPDPTRTLAPEARTLWTLTALGQALALFLVGGALGARFVPDGLRLPVLVLAATAAVIHVGVLPGLRWRRWRYEVRAQEIDLQRGAFTVRRTLVPMNRVQHVDTRRTVVSEMFGLAAVVFHTAAGANEIPALREAEAAEIRDRIADLAATAEDPV